MRSAEEILKEIVDWMQNETPNKCDFTDQMKAWERIVSEAKQYFKRKGE